MVFEGALLCYSDTKLDQAGKSEDTVAVEVSHTVDGSFPSHVGSTMKMEQAEVNYDNNNEETTSTMPSNSAS